MRPQFEQSCDLFWNSLWLLHQSTFTRHWVTWQKIMFSSISRHSPLPSSFSPPLPNGVPKLLGKSASKFHWAIKADLPASIDQLLSNEPVKCSHIHVYYTFVLPLDRACSIWCLTVLLFMWVKLFPWIVKSIGHIFGLKENQNIWIKKQFKRSTKVHSVSTMQILACRGSYDANFIWLFRRNNNKWKSHIVNLTSSR